MVLVLGDGLDAAEAFEFGAGFDLQAGGVDVTFEAAAGFDGDFSNNGDVAVQLAFDVEVGDADLGIEVAVAGDAQGAGGFDEGHAVIVGDDVVFDADALMAIRADDAKGAFADEQFLEAMRTISFFFSSSKHSIKGP